jgi:hypothetical protein
MANNGLILWQLPTSRHYRALNLLFSLPELVIVRSARGEVPVTSRILCKLIRCATDEFNLVIHSRAQHHTSSPVNTPYSLLWV